MKLTKTVVAAFSLAVALTSTAPAPVGATPVTTNPLRDNPWGTVEIIDVAAGSSIASCPNPTGACTIATSVVLDPLDPNALSPSSAGPVYLANTTLYLFLLSGSVPADLNLTDCSRSTDLPDPNVSRPPLGTATTGTSGKVTISGITLPAGKWTYGLNWLCASSVLNVGGAGAIGDQAFFITP